MADPLERPAAPLTCTYAPAPGEGPPLASVNPLAEGPRRGRSKQVANTPPQGVRGFAMPAFAGLLRDGHFGWVLFCAGPGRSGLRQSETVCGARDGLTACSGAR